MQAQAIRTVKRVGVRKTLDFTVDHPDHNFYAEGVVVSNSHAYEYGYVTAMTTYLKANYPKQFTFALLKLSKHEPNSQTVLTAIIAESKHLGIAILPPDIMKSQEDFAIEENGVRFGLSHIRGISDTTMAKLVSFRREHATKFDIFGAAQEAKISIAVLTGLIMCGALDTRGVSRAKVTLEAQTYNLLTPREVLLVNQLGVQYDYDLLAIIKALSTKTDEKGKPFIKESRLATLRRDFAPYEAMFKENSKNEQLCCLLAERHYLGFSYSATLREVFGKKVEGLQPISEVVTEVGNAQVRFVAFIDEVKSAVGLKSGKPYVRFDMSDETGSLKVMISGEETIESVRQFHGEIPKEGDLIIVSGHKAQDGDTVFVSMGGRFKQQRGESFVKQATPFLIRKSGLVVEI